MAYKIIDISTCIPEVKQYFFDSNAWIFILDPPVIIGKTEKSYIDFFDAICNLRSSIPLASKKKNPPLPEIIVSPLLISEVFNRLTRMSFDLWKEDLKRIGKLSMSISSNNQKFFPRKI